MTDNTEYTYYKAPNGDFIRVRVIDGVIPLHHIIEHQSASNFSGYRLIAKDLDLIKEALLSLKEVKNQQDKIVKQSLSFFIIITYGKCFAAADGRKIKLEESSVLKLMTTEEFSIHSEFIRIRNNYVAHSGTFKYEKNPVTAIKVEVPDGTFEYSVYDSPVFVYGIVPDYTILNNLLEKLYQYVDDKISKNYDAVIPYDLKALEAAKKLDNINQIFVCTSQLANDYMGAD
ncbi:hypothetical protein EON73_04880, partial [bacterium]